MSEADEQTQQYQRETNWGVWDASRQQSCRDTSARRSSEQRNPCDQHKQGKTVRKDGRSMSSSHGGEAGAGPRVRRPRWGATVWSCPARPLVTRTSNTTQAPGTPSGKGARRGWWCPHGMQHHVGDAMAATAGAFGATDLVGGSVIFASRECRSRDRDAGRKRNAAFGRWRGVRLVGGCATGPKGCASLGPATRQRTPRVRAQPRESAKVWSRAVVSGSRDDVPKKKSCSNYMHSDESDLPPCGHSRPSLQNRSS